MKSVFFEKKCTGVINSPSPRELRSEGLMVARVYSALRGMWKSKKLYLKYM